jgi:hypothetical protein
LLKRDKRRAKFYDFDEYPWLVDAAHKIDSRINVAVLLGGGLVGRCATVSAYRRCRRRSLRSFSAMLCAIRFWSSWLRVPPCAGSPKSSREGFFAGGLIEHLPHFTL